MKSKKKQKTSSIKTKLSGIIIPVVIIMVIILISLSYSISKKIIKKDSENLLSSSIQNQSTQIKSWLDENLSAFQIVKATIEGVHPSDQDLQTMLDQYYGFNANYPEGIYVGTEDGKLFQAADAAKDATDILNSQWYEQGLTRVNMGFGTAYTDGNGKSIVSASGILNDQSGKVKVISADLPLDHISIIVNSFIEMDNAQAFLVDSTDGTILANRDSSLISTKLDTSNADKFLSAVAEKLENRAYDMVELDNNLTAFEKVAGTDWILISYVPTATIYKDLNELRTIMVLIAVISILLLVVLIERVVHLVIKPVKVLTSTITSMSEGDFTIEVNTKGKDEIAVMGQSVKTFTASMRAMIADINAISKTLAEQAESSSNTSNEMYDASRVQADSMRELNETVDQLSVSVNEIANSATTLAMVVSGTKDDSVVVDEKMQETVAVSEKGRDDMQKVGLAMDNIKVSIGELEKAINEVGTASEEIKNIIGLIGNIAEETNLLSLNASIEAARAGEAGKGFAVVATEIGKLAQTSADAVQNISNLIGEVNLLVKNAVDQAGESAQNINGSSELINTAVETFNAIFDNIQQTNSLIKDMIDKVGKVDDVATSVAAISEEQAASADEILATAENMVNQSNNITKNSEDVAESSRELAKTSEKLEKQVQAFRI